jgi:ABC-type sugar transport system substrate-binding protein
VVRIPRIRWLLLVVLLLAATVAAGCGDDDSSSSSESGIKQSKSASERQDAAAAGKKMGQDEGDPVGLEKQKVGLLLVVPSEIVLRSEAAVKDAAKELGWSVQTCDAQGVAAKFTSCAETLLNGGATVMVSVATESAPMKAQMERAKKEGIPWINTTGLVTPTDLFSTQITERELELATTLSDYVIEKMNGKGTLAYSTLPSLYAIKIRADKLLSELTAKAPQITPIPVEADLADILGRTRPGSQYPDRPLIAAAYGTLVNLAAIRKGTIDAVAEMAVESTSWMALDMAAEHFARDKPFPPDSDAVEDQYPIPFLETTLITKDNLPKNPKSYFAPEHDFVSFFNAKWDQEFPADERSK